MSSELSVYQRMKSSTAELKAVVLHEIGVKACLPFTVKAVDALQSLSSNLTDAEMRVASNVFLSNLQTLTQGGITTEDYDKIDFVKRGKTICVSARVEALLRAATRKGYRIIETIVPVPKADATTTYFEEIFDHGNIVYILKDLRKQGDRKITSERIRSSYFDKFLCRLEIVEAKTNKRLIMTVTEVSNEEILATAAASDNGLYSSKWETYKGDWGKEKKRKVVTNEPNKGSIWDVWTAEMVNKTVIRRAMKRIKEVLPELGEVVMAFDTDVQTQQQTEETQTPQSEPITVHAIEVSHVNIFELTENQMTEAEEMLEIYKQNPQLATQHAEEIKKMFECGVDIQEICDSRYAEIVNIAKSKNTYPVIEAFLNVVKEAVNNGTEQ